jgi:hypothetical protein
MVGITSQAPDSKATSWTTCSPQILSIVEPLQKSRLPHKSLSVECIVLLRVVCVVSQSLVGPSLALSNGVGGSWEASCLRRSRCEDTSMAHVSYVYFIWHFCRALQLHKEPINMPRNGSVLTSLDPLPTPYLSESAAPRNTTQNLLARLLTTKYSRYKSSAKK